MYKFLLRTTGDHSGNRPELHVGQKPAPKPPMVKFGQECEPAVREATLQMQLCPTTRQAIRSRD